MRSQTIHAAKTVLAQCLALPPGAELVVFADETTINTASIIAEAAVNLELKPVVAYFTQQMQIELGDKGLFPGVESLLDDAVAALVCLNSTPHCLPFRDRARQSALNAGCKVAHMPGINQATLLLADIDYETLTAQCELLALALAKGQHMEIVTQDHKGEKHHLHLPLHAWRRLPIISDGIIQKDSWGNVPSGETYIAPPEGLAEGSIVINGSIPGYTIPPGEEIILRFHQGRLVRWTPAGSPAVQHLLNTQIEWARLQGDENWDNLAEVGLGANPRVQTLTGIPLLDEKKYGSIHIALGDNVDMGGQVASRIHCDMVALSPEVVVDGRVIIKDGAIVIREEEWREDHRAVQPTAMWQPDLSVACMATNVHIDEQGQLHRLWDTSSGRVCMVKVGSGETSRQAAAVYQVLKRRAQPMMIADLAMLKPNLDLTQLLQLTYLLQQYELIKIQNHDT
ncbi:MAG: aminopeptidase [Chloroflexi bacterium]|nr:aminopeptidase [Chloroflexota bacterium]